LHTQVVYSLKANRLSQDAKRLFNKLTRQNKPFSELVLSAQTEHDKRVCVLYQTKKLGILDAGCSMLGKPKPVKDELGRNRESK